ncbi:MAG: hypothetical protein EFT35_04880 [Methanophagales archaeon ANME-1-THS]|nr:MAG: hypothetical protein EFT35_04880 [Methanophagales archaeon ANME-1-THS]
MRRPKLVGSTATVLLLSSMLVLTLGSVPVLGELEFGEWYSMTMDRIELDAMSMAISIENFDCTGVEAGARSGSEAATAALDELEGYEVSPEMQPVKEHVKLALENFTAACTYAETGAMKYNAADLKTAARYVNASLGHLEEIDKLGLVSPAPVGALKRLEGDLEHAAKIIGGAQPSPSPSTSPTPTQKAPGYGAILAVGGLFIVAYRVLRRAR